MNDVMETMSNVEKYLKSFDAVSVLHKQENIDKIIECVGHMKLDIDALIKDEPPKSGEAVKEQFKDVLTLLIDVCLTVPFTCEFSSFLENITLLFFNWDANVFHDEDLKTKIMAIDNIRQGHFTLMELFSVMKKVSRRMERLSPVTIPAIELSKHYLESLSERCREE